MNLSDKQKKVAQELAVNKKSFEDIAKEYNISVRTLYNWRQDEDFNRCYKGFLDNIFMETSAQAISTILNLMENAESENVRFNCAKDILSRAGFDATAKTKTELSTPEEIVINIV